MGGEGEGSGVKGGGKWGERGREVGVGYPPVHPLYKDNMNDGSRICKGSFMRSKHLCVLIHIRIKGDVGTVIHI